MGSCGSVLIMERMLTCNSQSKQRPSLAASSILLLLETGDKQIKLVQGQEFLRFAFLLMGRTFHKTQVMRCLVRSFEQ